MVTKIRSVVIEVEVDTNYATHERQYKLSEDYSLNEILEDIKEYIEGWLAEEGR